LGPCPGSVTPSRRPHHHHHRRRRRRRRRSRIAPSRLRCRHRQVRSRP
jgi:hypothetical protein